MMRLWEAMLAGAKKGPQLFNMQENPSGASCALGAIGIGGTGNPFMYTNEHNKILSESSSCPVGPCSRFTLGDMIFDKGPYSVATVIAHLNNDHRWSRQRIAEWLANRELKFLPASSPKGEIVCH